MDTRFSDLSQYRPDAKWMPFFHAAHAWLMTYELLKKNRNTTFFGFMYVDPHIAALCLELSVKSLAAYEDPKFSAKKYGHRTSEILYDLKNKVPEFATVTNDNELIKLVKEYEKAVESRYGIVGGNISYAEQQKIMDTAHTLFNAMCERTNLRM